MEPRSARIRSRGVDVPRCTNRGRSGRERAARSSGFVLLEVLLATAVMTGGILFALDALRSAAQLADIAEQRQRAIYMLEEQLVGIEEAPTLAAGVQTGTISAPRGDFSYRLTVGAVEQDVSSSPGRLWLIEAEVQYPSRPNPRTVQASRYIWKREPES